MFVEHLPILCRPQGGAVYIDEEGSFNSAGQVTYTSNTAVSLASLIQVTSLRVALIGSFLVIHGLHSCFPGKLQAEADDFKDMPRDLWPVPGCRLKFTTPSLVDTIFLSSFLLLLASTRNAYTLSRPCACPTSSPATDLLHHPLACPVRQRTVAWTWLLQQLLFCFCQICSY